MSNITLTIIKPDAVQDGHTGAIIDQIIKAGFRVKAMKLMQLSEREAGKFYAVHSERPFYKDLVRYMSSGPVVPMVLEKTDAVQSFRTLIGATDPQKADEGTIRKNFGKSLESNAIHGSDSDENAKIEANFFFADLEIH